MKKIADNSSFMTYRLVCIKSNTSGVTSGAGTTYSSGTHGITILMGCMLFNMQFSVLCFIDHCLSFCIVSPYSINVDADIK